MWRRCWLGPKRRLSSMDREESPRTCSEKEGPNTHPKKIQKQSDSTRFTFLFFYVGCICFSYFYLCFCIHSLACSLVCLFVHSFVRSFVLSFFIHLLLSAYHSSFHSFQSSFHSVFSIFRSFPCFGLPFILSVFLSVHSCAVFVFFCCFMLFAFIHVLFLYICFHCLRVFSKSLFICLYDYIHPLRYCTCVFMFVFANKLTDVKRVVCFPNLRFLRYKWWEHPDQTLGAIWNVDAHHPLLHAQRYAWSAVIWACLGHLNIVNGTPQIQEKSHYQYKVYQNVAFPCYPKWQLHGWNSKFISIKVPFS